MAVVVVVGQFLELLVVVAVEEVARQQGQPAQRLLELVAGREHRQSRLPILRWQELAGQSRSLQRTTAITVAAAVVDARQHQLVASAGRLVMVARVAAVAVAKSQPGLPLCNLQPVDNRTHSWPAVVARLV